MKASISESIDPYMTSVPSSQTGHGYVKMSPYQRLSSHLLRVSPEDRVYCIHTVHRYSTYLTYNDLFKTIFKREKNEGSKIAQAIFSLVPNINLMYDKIFTVYKINIRDRSSTKYNCLVTTHKNLVSDASSKQM